MLLGHWFLYKTWESFWPAFDPPGISALQIVLALLSVSFVVASMLAWRYANLAIRVFYTLAAVWLGFFSFCFFGACACWIVYDAARIAGLHPDPQIFAIVFFGGAVLLSLYGLINAAWTRVTRVTVRLPNLPDSWRGRVAALVSDTHLGHVHGYRFIQRIVALLNRLQPDIVFIPGDVYDGTAANLEHLARPLSQISAPLGAYFVTGNHEEFTGHDKYLHAIEQSGVRVLNNEQIIVDGLQLVGVHDSVNPVHLRGILRQANLDRETPSVLLTHAPHALGIAEQEGISLQLSGHTHGGQFVPFTWLTARIYGKFIYGLQRMGKMLVYTSYGAGTWGPPMRVGTKPEVVLIQFQAA